MRLHGLIVPLITPFTKSGELNFDALENTMSFIEDYIDGILICGTFGSGPLMHVDERMKVAEYILDRIKNRIKTIVHVGSTDTLTSIKLAKHAEDIGADVVMSLPPYYYKHREVEVLHHYRELISSVNIPVYAYNNPKTVGYEITPELLSKLVELGISGIKDSSFDIFTFMNYMIKCGDKIDLIMGTEALMLPAYSLGCRVFIAGMLNYFPELVRELYNELESSNYDRAREIQYKIVKVRNIVYKYPPIIATHAILKLKGINSGYPKPPYKPLTDDEIEYLRRELSQYGVI